MVDGFKIEGNQELNGVIEVGGAKNAVLPILIGTLIEKGEYNISNVPNLRDIRVLIKLLESLGLIVEKIGANEYKIINNGITNNEASYDIVKKMRASFLVMGPMIANLPEAIVSLPGGCAIGSRPVDIHIKGLEDLGVKITTEHGYIHAKKDELIGNHIMFKFPSVGATENVMMAAVKAKGTTIIENAAKEPEIKDLGNFLNAMGAEVTGHGTSTITIVGKEKLHSCDYRIMPDRIEAGTYIIASIVTKGNLKIKDVVLEDLGAFKYVLEDMGVKFHEDGDILTVEAELEKLKPASIKTMPHPGFPTDLQSPMMLLMALVNGTSEVEETVFENRFMHVQEFNRMGTEIDIRHGIAVINGVKGLSSAEVMASDLRAGASLVIAGLIADGETIVNRIYHVDRGYENLEGKLKAVGANIERIKLEI